MGVRVCVSVMWAPYEILIVYNTEHWSNALSHTHTHTYMYTQKVIYCPLMLERIVRKKYACLLNILYQAPTQRDTRTHTHRRTSTSQTIKMVQWLKSRIEWNRIDLLTFLRPFFFTFLRVECVSDFYSIQSVHVNSTHTDTHTHVCARHGTVIF